MKLAARFSKLLAAMRAPAAISRSEVAALPAPLIVALEPRIVYDASAASIGMAAAVAQQHPASADTHDGASAPAAVPVSGAGARAVDSSAATGAVHGSTNTPPAAGVGDASTVRAVQGYTDVVGASADKQVVFVNSNVSDLQTLVAGLPAGTQYVVLDSTKDGLLQIEQYLHDHPGVSAIHLVSHGAAGEFQVGSTWINEADWSTYSTEFAQIGASMKAGGDFLIYGCDVAGNADGKALVQQISSISGLNVAASTDATGAATLGGDWVLEYDAGAVHTGVIFSAASEQNYDHVLSAYDETYDGSVGYDSGTTPVASTTLGLSTLTYTGDQAVEYQVVGGSLPASGSGGELVVNTQGTQMSTLTLTRQDGGSMAIESFDIDIFVSNDVAVQALDGSGNVLGSITLDVSAGATAYTPGHVASSSLFHVDLSSNAAFSQVKSIKFVETSGNGTYLSPTLDNFTYLSPSSPPTLTASGGTTAFVAGDNVASTPVVVDSGVTLTDGNSTTATSATVSIVGNLHNTEDVLAFTNTSAATYGNISAAYNATTGILTLSSSGGTASIAQWQAALRAVTYTDTAVTPNATTRTISFTAVDGAGNTSATATRTVTVTDTDQTPIVTTTGGTTNYIGGTSAATIDGGVSVSDRDNTTQALGTISISAGFHSGDTLTFVNTNSATFGNIVGSYNAVTGVLTLTSSGATSSDTQWSNALSAVTFSAGSSATPGNRTISFTTSDGTKTSAVGTDTVVVLGPPTITTDSGSAVFVAGDNVASTPVAIDAGLTLTDGAAPTLASATVAITGNFHSGEDVLAFVNTNAATFGNIAASYNAGTGVLTLTSSGATASLAQWQAALDAVTYTDTAVTPSNATRTISFAAVDTSATTSNTATRTVTVTDTDQTPIVTTTGGTTRYVGASSAVTIDSGISVSDLDNTTQSIGTVSIGTGFNSGDTLSFTNTSSASFGNIVGSYNAVTGLLTLTSAGATASDAQWSHALSAVTFATTSATLGNRTISFATSDGTKTSAVATDTVAVLDRPHVTLDSGAASFVAADNATSTPVTVAPGLTLTDATSSTFSASVSITGGFHQGEDVLALASNSATMGDISAAYAANSGVLTLTSRSGNATRDQWQAALAAITYTDTAITPAITTRVISFTVTDGNGAASAVQTRSVTVADTDQTPLLSVSGGVTFTARGNGSTPVAVAPQVTITDADNTTLTSAQVAISGGFDAEHDTLSFTGSAATGNITMSSYNAATGVLTLTSAGGTATIAQWAAALQSVTYSDSSQSAGSSRTISFAVSDGVKSSALASNTVAIAHASLFPPIVPAAPPVIVDTPASSHSSIFSDDTSPPDVLDEFDRPMPIGSVPIVQTMTFTDPNAPANMHSLDHTSVPSLDIGMAALAPNDVQSSLPDVSFTMAPNDPFSINVATLLPPLEAMQGGADITVRLADGRTLPGWIRYDAAHGVLRGKLPVGVENVRIVVQTRDASGHETRREIVLAPRGNHAGHGDSHGASHGVTHPKPPGHAALAEPSVARAARPVGKPSLDRQFAQARAALHVSHPRVASRRA
jgi:hypothetical protein